MICFHPVERSSANEEDVLGVDLNVLLLRVLAPALGGHARDRALEDLQERLLHALAGDVPGDRGFSDLRAILSISSM